MLLRPHKLRETLLGRLDADARRSLHRRTAELIEAINGERAFELAFHFDAAGEHERALPYALRSAEPARAQHSLEVALTHYRIAQRAAEAPSRTDAEPESSRALQAQIAVGLGDVLTLQGDYVEASRLLEHALGLTDDSVERAVLDGKLGDVAFKTGAPARARSYLEGSLRDLGRWVPRSGLAMVLAALKEVVVQALHTLVPRLFVARRTLAGSEREFLAIRMYSRLAYVYWFSAGKVPCAWARFGGTSSPYCSRTPTGRRQRPWPPGAGLQLAAPGRRLCHGHLAGAPLRLEGGASDRAATRPAGAAGRRPEGHPGHPCASPSTSTTASPWSARRPAPPRRSGWPRSCGPTSSCSTSPCPAGTASRCRAAAGAPEATIVLLTALDVPGVLADGGDAADGVLDKTRDLGQFVGQLTDLVGH